MMRIIPTLAVTSVLFVTAVATTTLAAPKSDRVRVSYETPEDPELLPIYEELMERRPLERLREFLSPFQLPRILTIRLAGCDGEADAFYGDDEITICYEYVDLLWKNMPAETTPGGVEPMDTVVGPFFDTSLHEFAHALFDIFNLPVFGRQEDAADQVAAYIYLQLGYEESRRLIRGTAYTFLIEAQNADVPRSLEDFSDEHGTPAQRAYNLLCMAYGADTKEFGDLVSKGYLPRDRADLCEEEYEQVQDAYEALVFPHIDQDLAKEIFKTSWLRM